jgi:hypothetical protein
MLDESSAVASNKRSESFQGNLPKLEIKYFEIQWFYNTAGSGFIKKWLLVAMMHFWNQKNNSCYMEQLDI